MPEPCVRDPLTVEHLGSFRRRKIPKTRFIKEAPRYALSLDLKLKTDKLRVYHRPYKPITSAE